MVAIYVPRAGPFTIDVEYATSNAGQSVPVTNRVDSYLLVRPLFRDRNGLQVGNETKPFNIVPEFQDGGAVQLDWQ